MQEARCTQAPSAIAGRNADLAERWPNSEGGGEADDSKPFGAASSGVRVSSRAKNAGASALNSTWRAGQRKPHQRARGRGGVGRGERAMLEQHPHDRLGEHEQPERRRQREPGRELQRARLRMRDRVAIVATHGARQSGTSTVPMATPTRPSGSSIRRLAK